jgi:hypothetical protein
LMTITHGPRTMGRADVRHTMREAPVMCPMHVLN